MTQKTLIVADPGIDGAFAITLALHDPDVEVVGLAATAGNVPAERATRNIHIVVEQIDPPRWPRLGMALPIEYETAATDLHGPDGLGGLDFPCATLRHPHHSDALIGDLLRQNPKELTVLILGPATVFARALDRDPELAHLVGRVVMVGGAWHEPGDASAVAEFHFFCDPPSVRQVLRSGVPLTLVPLDVTRKFIFSPGDIRQLPEETVSTGRFLRRLLPLALAPTAGRYGIEGLYLGDVVGLVAAIRPGACTTKSIHADVETRGELTRGMSVFDARWSGAGKPNVDLVTDIDLQVVRQYVLRTLSLTDQA
jgi:inosine-uridine nucleoside N-ribohydrolase